MNSPDNLVVHPDGSSGPNPAYGIGGDYEGYRAESKSPWPSTAWTAPPPVEGDSADEADGPNGICFSPDYHRSTSLIRAPLATSKWPTWIDMASTCAVLPN